jgi:hypothetical protein
MASKKTNETPDMGKWGNARRVEIKRVKLSKTGDVFTGQLLGKKEVPWEDVRQPKDSEKRHTTIIVWQFSDNGLTCEMAGDWQINSLLSTLPLGHFVRIERLDQITKGAQKVNQYDIRALSPEEMGE